MRIAVFTDNFHPELGGIQDSIITTVRELGARHHQIMVLAPAAAARDYTRVNLPLAELDLGPNVMIRRLFSLPVPSSSQQSRIVVPTGLRWADVARFSPDLIHSHTFLAVGLEGARAARRIGVPLIGTNHWAVGAFDDYVPFGQEMFRRVSRHLVARYYQSCDWVTGPSKFTIDDLVTSGLTRPNSIISNPIDTERFRPVDRATKQSLKARLGLGPNVVVYAGRLGREKCVDVLIRAFAALDVGRMDAMLVIAGHGSARDSLAALASSLGVGERVRFVGTLEHDALAQLFAAADIFAIASTSETQSMVLLQAMACGLPVIGARRGGLIEHIPAEVGRLANPDQPDDFRGNLLALLTDDAMRERMGAAAREFVKAFSIARVADLWEDIYRRLIRDVTTGRVPLMETTSDRSGRSETCA